MIEVLAQVSSNKNITLSKKSFGNKLDNSITKVIFNDICEDGNLSNRYVAFLSPKSEIFLFPLNSKDNSFIVTYTITKYAGTWRMVYLATNTPISEDGNIDYDYKVFVSNNAEFTITENFLTDIIEEPIIDENLEIIYEQLNQTIIYLNSDDFKEELIQNLHISDEDLNKIMENLKSDEEFKEDLRGEDGKSAYQSWLDLGNKGTEKEFLDSLKGADGESGKGAYTEWIELNRYEVGGIKGDNQFFWNRNVLELILSKNGSYDGKVVLKTDCTTYTYNSKDEVFNVYNNEDLTTRVDWIDINSLLKNDYAYVTLKNSTEIVEIEENLLLRECWMSIEEYSLNYLKGDKGADGRQGVDGKSAFDIWESTQPMTIVGTSWENMTEFKYAENQFKERVLFREDSEVYRKLSTSSYSFVDLFDVYYTYNGMSFSLSAKVYGKYLYVIYNGSYKMLFTSTYFDVMFKHNYNDGTYNYVYFDLLEIANEFKNQLFAGDDCINDTSIITFRTYYDSDIAYIDPELTEEDFLNSLSPVRGVDYWTETDIQAMKDFCKAYIDSILKGES